MGLRGSKLACFRDEMSAMAVTDIQEKKNCITEKSPRNIVGIKPR